MGNLGTSKFPIFINEYEYLQRDYHKLKIMAEIPFLVKDLALILMVAGIVTLIFKRLKQPLVLGYIVAGFLVSPHMPYTMSVMTRRTSRPGQTSVSSLRSSHWVSTFLSRKS